jgi:hypothetical protein
MLASIGVRLVSGLLAGVHNPILRVRVGTGAV